MPKFRMTYPYARRFYDLGVVVQPDEVIEAVENPDGNFFEPVDGPAVESDPPKVAAEDGAKPKDPED